MSTKSPLGSNLLKVYFMLVSLAGIVGATIGYGIMFHGLLSYHLINDEEYLLNNYREIEACEQGKRNPRIEQEEPRSEAEITTCKEQKRSETLLRRGVDYKESLIAGIVRGTLFLILFGTHFPSFLRHVKRDS